jgi:DNA polymerase elongation subunit (family B)
VTCFGYLGYKNARFGRIEAHVIKQAQRDALDILARAPNVEHLEAYLPKVVALWQDRLDDMRSGQVPLEQLLVT